MIAALLRLPLRSLLRRIAYHRLALVDADVAHWFVNDGSLHNPGDYSMPLRRRRDRAVRDLEHLGGHDPAPVLVRAPTDVQRRANPTCPSCGILFAPSGDPRVVQVNMSADVLADVCRSPSVEPVAVLAVEQQPDGTYELLLRTLHRTEHPQVAGDRFAQGLRGALVEHDVPYPDVITRTAVEAAQDAGLLPDDFAESVEDMTA